MTQPGPTVLRQTPQKAPGEQRCAPVPLAIAAIGQAAQGHNADEIVFSVWAALFVGLAAWFLRDGFAAGTWMLFPIVYAAKLTGDSTGRWWIVVPVAAVTLAGLVLIDRHFYKDPPASNDHRAHHGSDATALE